MKANTHPNEAQRLNALRGYGILDSPTEDDYDDIAALAAAICQTPISLVSFVDEDRNWFKAEVGAGMSESPLNTAFCAHAILESDLVEINDARTDPRTAQNPLVSGEPHLRFYAGAQLMTANNLPLGTLCVFDVKPRHLEPHQREALRILARLVMKQLDLNKAMADLHNLRHEADHRIKNSLQSVSTMIRMQTRASDDPAVHAVLGATQAQVQSVAALHKELSQASGPDRIDLNSFLGRVAALIAETAPQGVIITSDFDVAHLPVQKAAALATILNEFAANSFKHAFPDGQGGTLRLQGLREDGHTYILTCADDGIGLSGGTANAPGDGIGQQIIDGAITQAGAHRLDALDGPARGHMLRLCVSI